MTDRHDVNSDKRDSPWYKIEIGPRLITEVKAFYEQYSGQSGDQLLEHFHLIVRLSCVPFVLY